jgi:hypothetical protein
MRAISLRSLSWDATPEGPAVADNGSLAAAEAITDLHLDRVLAAAPDVAPLIGAPLREPDAVAYRHEVFRDLETPVLAEAAGAFVEGIGSARAQLERAGRLRHRLERARRVLEALEGYRTAVEAFGAALDSGPVTSRGLAAVRDELRAYRSSEAFTRLTDDATRTLAGLGAVTYRLRIEESRIVVGRHDDEPDYGAQVAATLARLRTAGTPARPPFRADRFETPDLNPLEAEILDKVARGHPAAFAALEAFAADHGEGIDIGAVAVADDLRAYLGWLALIAPLREAGIAFCYPTVVGAGRDPAAAGSRIEARALVDLALALRHVPVGEPVVANDFVLGSGERLAVITGPNQSGKTALARAIGQLARLAATGVPVPAASAHLALADGVYTLFARAEDPADLTGRLEAELLRARAILSAVGPASVVIINEAFASTTADDALALDRALLAELKVRSTTAVLVTFLGELASVDDATVSLGGIPDPDDPARPTYRFERRPADDLAHARVVATAHHLDHETVRERVRR